MEHYDYLSRRDPLRAYLCEHVLPQLGVDGAAAEFRVRHMHGTNHVYVYEEERSGLRVIGKFFGGVAGRSTHTAARYLEREWSNLVYLRDGLGFTGYPHYVARPLGRNAALGCVLIEEFCHGVSLSTVLSEATRGAHRELYRKLTALAWFLATLHNRTAREARVDFEPECRYYRRIVDQLSSQRVVDDSTAAILHALLERWRGRDVLREDGEVLVHGDVTPANILYGEHPWVIAIDVERMRTADRVFDVGRVVGEIKHHFMQDLGDRHAAEPFIGHFLWEYACHFPDRSRAFQSITRRVPFYMGLTLLRIARNGWVTGAHRRALVHEAMRILQS